MNALNSKKIFLIRYFFLFTMVPYFLIRPVTVYFFEYGPHSEPPSFEVMRAVLLFPLTCLMFFYFGYFYSKRNKNYSNSLIIFKPNKFYFIILYGLSLTFAAIFFYQLLSYFNQEIYESRAERGSGLYITQAWVVITAFFQVLLMSSFWFSLKYNIRHLKILTFTSLFLFIILEIFLLSSRRELLVIILFVSFVSFSHYEKFKLKYVLGILAFILVSFLVIGYSRQGDILSWTDAASLILTTNEFAAVGEGFVVVMEEFSIVQAYRLGDTYIASLLQFIPRAIWESKPVSIAHYYGVATSLYLEAFINFSFLGAFVFIPLGAIFSKLIEKNNLLSYVIVAYSLDFWRGDSGVIIFYFSIFLFFYLFLFKAIRVK